MTNSRNPAIIDSIQKAKLINNKQKLLTVLLTKHNAIYIDQDVVAKGRKLPSMPII